MTYFVRFTIEEIFALVESFSRSSAIFMISLLKIDFQSGTIIEQLNQNTHVYQYILNSMVRIELNEVDEDHRNDVLFRDNFVLLQTPLASRYFCEVRSWRTNIQLNTNGSCQSPISSNSNQQMTTTPVGSSSSASSSAIASFITSQNSFVQRREACVLVCTSIEHPKAHCPPTLGLSHDRKDRSNTKEDQTFLYLFSSSCNFSFEILDPISW